MKMKIDVSVIIPAYRCEKYIKKAIKSVLDQSSKYTVEVIVVNDHSNDNTGKVIREMITANPDALIRYVENGENLGASKSRNLGIGLAEGKYIAFLDGDDYWSKDKLEKQMPLFDNAQVRFVYAARCLITESGTLIKEIIPVPSKIYFATLLKSNVIPCGSVIVEKDILPNPAFVKDNLHEDYILWLNLLKNEKYAYGINEALLVSRMAPGGKSRNKIKSAKMNFGVYRYFGNSILKSLLLMVSYTINGLKKYH